MQPARVQHPDVLYARARLSECQRTCSLVSVLFLASALSKTRKLLVPIAHHARHRHTRGGRYHYAASVHSQVRLDGRSWARSSTFSSPDPTQTQPLERDRRTSTSGPVCYHRGFKTGAGNAPALDAYSARVFACTATKARMLRRGHSRLRHRLGDAAKILTDVSHYGDDPRGPKLRGVSAGYFTQSPRRAVGLRLRCRREWSQRARRP